MMGLANRIDVRLDAGLHQELRDFARVNGLARGAAARHLIATSLHETKAPGVDATPAQLAALVAAEHAVLMVASVLPEGETRMRMLAERASHAAEERLAMFVEPAAPGPQA